jgi:hypothetical protein
MFAVRALVARGERRVSCPRSATAGVRFSGRYAQIAVVPDGVANGSVPIAIIRRSPLSPVTGVSLSGERRHGRGKVRRPPLFRLPFAARFKSEGAGRKSLGATV